MTGAELAQKAKNIADNYKTLYVMGCFGAPLNDVNKARYTKNDAYNRQSSRTRMIKAATADTFGFDCVCLIKGILWGWNGDLHKSYGGASYASNGVPDIGADSMIKVCSGVSSSNWSNMAVGEAVWMSGHIGIYIGGGLAVECSPKWANKVQVTAVGNIGSKRGYNTRTWTKHGKLPYVTYGSTAAPKPTTPPTNTNKEEDDMTAEEVKRIVAEELDKREEKRKKQPVSDWAEKEMKEAVSQHITDGTRPQDYCTRQEAAIMVKRAAGASGLPF